MELNFPQLEEKILKYWRENKTFEKSIKQRAKARDFIFYEGPPTANGRPGIHHVLARTYKDIICRYKTMRGFKVLRKAGWDTHGLPVELEIEKKLGLKSKKDIEKYGIARFNQKCKQSVWTYKKDWEKLTERTGFWLDMENPYITYQTDYIETLWWIIKRIFEKGLLYKGYKVVPYCPRCGTSLSSHEVALGYKKIKEPAIYVKLKIQNPKSKNTYLLVWTTTPWTLPGNVAVAVNPKFTYVKVKVNDEYLILAKERMGVLGIEGETPEEIQGKDLLGTEYEPLFPVKLDKKAYFIIAGDFVSLQEGTGLVHIAPAFGEEDMAVGKENDLPVLLNVDEGGRFKKEVKDWTGLFVKDADPLIIKDLEERNRLFKEELYEHDYPFCWRCSSPLLYYAKESWFIKMQQVKKDLIKNNQQINWLPAHLKEGRFGEWLKDLKDWAFSRERYWGTPLPIWQCQKCGEKEVIGSKKDLISQKFSTNKYYILRHGYSLRNEKNIISSWPEVVRLPLTAKGKKQVRESAQKLKKEKIDIIFSSDILRTRQTAEIVALELQLKVNYTPRLRDINLGVFNGKLLQDFYQVFNLKDLFWKRPPRGENWADCKKRMVNFIKSLEKKYKDKKILIISHGDPLWLLDGAMKGWSNRQLWRSKEGHRNYIGVGEFRKLDFKNLPYDSKMQLDFHRPHIDEVKFHCKKCSKPMTRLPELIDVWFDSGAMPFAQYHYPFDPEGKLLVSYGARKDKLPFPADYISEAVDQTRGWFYTLLAVSALLGKGPAYKNVISLGHILDEKGEKMSKSKGNVVDPWYIIEKYGADATRWYFYTVNQPGDSKLFSEKDVDQVLKKFVLTLWNCHLFFQTYRMARRPMSSGHRTSKNILDRWIVSRLNELIQEVTEKLDKYEVTAAARAIENFVINDLSLWYIRRSRKRFSKAAGTLALVLQTLSKLTAPLIPFISEEINQEKRSVHLQDWPKVDARLIDKKLNKAMEKVRETVRLALAERAKSKIKVRQPLLSLQIPARIATQSVAGGKEKLNKELLDLIKEEVNVKKIVFGKAFKLDTKITPELKEEGIIREVIRQIQDLRRKAGLKPKDKISVQYLGTPELNKIMEKRRRAVLDQTQAKGFALKAVPERGEPPAKGEARSKERRPEESGREKSKKAFLAAGRIKIDGQNLWLSITEARG